MKRFAYLGKLLFTCLFMPLIFQHAFAQNGFRELEGSVKDADGKVLKGATIPISGLNA